MHAHNKKNNGYKSLLKKKQVLTKAFIAMAGMLQLNQKELSAIIGPSTASLSRIFNNPKVGLNPTSKEGQLALLLLRLYRSLDVLFGGNAKQCQTWLRSYNQHLQSTPIDLIKSVEGLVLVIHYLDAMRGKN